MHQQQQVRVRHVMRRRIVAGSLIAVALAAIVVSLDIDQIRRALCTLYSEGDPLWYVYGCYLP